jgi:hypothetical protein
MSEPHRTSGTRDDSIERARLSKLTQKIYKQYTFLDDVVKVVGANRAAQTSSSPRTHITRKVVLENWLEPNVIHDLVFQELARQVGLEERRIVMDRLSSDNFQPQSGEFKLETIDSAINAMTNRGFHPDALLLPIQLYQVVFTRWDPTGRIVSYGPRPLITVYETRLKLFWSSIYVPFRDAFLVSRDFATWTVFPSPEQRLQVRFNALPDNEMEVIVETSFNFEVRRREGATRFSITELANNSIS